MLRPSDAAAAGLCCCLSCFEVSWLAGCRSWALCCTVLNCPCSAAAASCTLPCTAHLPLHIRFLTSSRPCSFPSPCSEKKAEAKRKGRKLGSDESDSDYDEPADGSGAQCGTR